MTNRTQWYAEYERILKGIDVQPKLVAFAEAATKKVIDEVGLYYIVDPWANMLVDHRVISEYVFSLAVYGDLFVEKVIPGGTEAVLKTVVLPAATMFRIETTKGKLVEFQQSKDGPDYKAIAINEDSETAVRFPPNNIVHFRMAINPKECYGYTGSIMRVNPDLWTQLCMDRVVSEMKASLSSIWTAGSAAA